MTNSKQQWRDQLRQQENQLPDDIKAQLQARRQQALALGSKSKRPLLLWPLTGMAAASALALVLVLFPEPLNLGQQATSVEAVSAQDLDFYYWLAETQPSLGS